MRINRINVNNWTRYAAFELEQKEFRRARSIFERALDVDSLRANMQGVLDSVHAHHPRAQVVIAGMMAPPNLGPAYTTAFARVYPELARANHATLIPFLLRGVAGVDSLNQSDGIHPNARGERIVAANVWRVLGPLLGKLDPSTWQD